MRASCRSAVAVQGSLGQPGSLASSRSTGTAGNWQAPQSRLFEQCSDAFRLWPVISSFLFPGCHQKCLCELSRVMTCPVLNCKSVVGQSKTGHWDAYQACNSMFDVQALSQVSPVYWARRWVQPLNGRSLPSCLCRDATRLSVHSPSFPSIPHTHAI